MSPPYQPFKDAGVVQKTASFWIDEVQGYSEKIPYPFLFRFISPGWRPQ